MATETITLYPASLNDSMNAEFPVTPNASYPLTNVIGKGSSNNTYAQWGFKSGRDVLSRVMYNFDTSQIPENATIDSISLSTKSMISDVKGNVATSKTIRLRNNDNGTYNILGTINIDSTTATESTVECTTVSREQLNILYLDISIVAGNKMTSSVYMRLYGATLTITYTVPDPPPEDGLYIKQDGQPQLVKEVYRIVNNQWVLQTNLIDIYDPAKKYIKKN